MACGAQGVFFPTAMGNSKSLELLKRKGEKW